MNFLQRVWLAVKNQPSQVANFFKQRRQQVVLNQLEAERLDRIRNPSKYRGK